MNEQQEKRLMRDKKMTELWLICGSRKQDSIYPNKYKETVFKTLNEILWNKRGLNSRTWTPEIMEGCCKGCADEYAEQWADQNLEGTMIHHYPAEKGMYLQRNITMVSMLPTMVIAFWDGYSYGTAHTIAHAVRLRIPVKIITI